ncbi:MAG: hypothetical protein JWM27_3104 [Gemmatimonadetes bacterium]|nr:hypothetical protein [Gemmatimonadota bacterium]
MIELLPFQIAAATTIADRYRAFASDTDRPRLRGFGVLPFFQSLQALTGAGKTPILADSIAQMRTASPIEPVVLWISKARVVVDQTLTNFQDGGKYHHLIEGFAATALRECTPRDIEDATTGILLLGTVATFNSKERGDRLIFGAREDVGEVSLWEKLVGRTSSGGDRRPLFIVYDEGHNLSEQQAELLLELRPDALILATATPKLPPRIAEIVDLLHRNGYEQEALTVRVASTDVVEAELVKAEVQLGGYVTAEEVAIHDMLTDYHTLCERVQEYALPLRPKCIYVCKTNVKDDEHRPFESRTAPPIRIWRYLVHECGIDPCEIAVYCDLKVLSSNPLPPGFVLFRGGDADYSSFTEGGYRHVIFNLSLQEGWDDPECYFAYIDKSMGSDLQVEQIIGRVLRQPGARYYPHPALNACAFYVHVDEDGVFARIMLDVQRRLAADLPAVSVISNGGARRTLRPQAPRKSLPLPRIYIDASAAAEPVDHVLSSIGSSVGEARASGRVAHARQAVGATATEGSLSWVDYGEGMPVTVQWYLRRQIERRYPSAQSVCDLNQLRFRQTVQIGSPATRHLDLVAEEVVRAYLEHVRLAVFPGLSDPIPEVVCDESQRVEFRNSLHAAYSGLNALELKCAEGLDAVGWPWMRNPSRSGFHLPLFELGGGRSFYPDFVVWTDRGIWLLDPKGDHLIQTEAGKKIVGIESPHGQGTVRVCLISSGRWDRQFRKTDTEGVTAWTLRGGMIHPEPFADYGRLLARVLGTRRATPVE